MISAKRRDAKFAEERAPFHERFEETPPQAILQNHIDGKPKDDYPELVRIPGVGFKDVVAVRYA